MKRVISFLIIPVIIIATTMLGPSKTATITKEVAGDERLLIGVISDTHIPTRAREIPDRVSEIFYNVDLIIHAGDVVEYPVIEVLEKIAPVTAVSGNVDGDGIREKYRNMEVIEKNGFRIGVIHETPLVFKMGTLRQIARENNLDVLVSGHTHRPFVEVEDNVLYLNPGSPTQPLLAKKTVALLKIEGKELGAEIVEV